MNAAGEAIEGTKAVDARFDLEAVFDAQYDRIARLIARIIRDPARSEELAVEVFLKLWRTPSAQGEGAEGWLYRTAVRAGLNELRGQTRRTRYERLMILFRGPSPEEIHLANEQQERVRAVLARIPAPQAELLILRSEGLTYGEIANTLELNPASVGTFVSRAQESFRKEYVRSYGKQS